MKNKKLIGTIIIAICICVLAGLFYFFAREEETKQGVAVLKESNIKELELGFGNLSQYINKEDAKLSVKDITESDLNDYRDDERILEHIYSYSGMLPLQEKEEIPFGAAYRIPAIVLTAGSNVLFSDTKGDAWKVEENAVKITYAFDIVSKPDLNKADLDIGFWKDGSFPTFTINSRDAHYESESWAFQGETFYPRISNIGGDDIIITNGIITISRDDAIKNLP